MQKTVEGKVNGGLLAVINGIVRTIRLSYLPPPVIIPSEGVDIYFNGVILTNPVEVSVTDRIILVAHKEVIREAKIRVSVSNNKMSAYLYVSPRETRFYHIPDQGLQRQLTVRAEENIEVTIPYTEEHVYALLQQEGVIHGILPEAIRDALLSTKEQEILVAQGTEPVAGVDETVDEFFARNVERNHYTESNNGIDFREHQKIPQVKPGDLLAQIIPGRPGQPGCTVTGKEIPSPPIKSIKLQAKNGVNIVNDNKVYAVDGGRPMVEGELIRYYSVVKLFYHNEDVTIKTGNLHFNGDLIINGNVSEFMTVTATGSITINGNIYNASIRAGQGIFIRGSTVGSTITASGGAAAFNLVAEKVGQLHTEVQNILQELSWFKKKSGIMEPEKLGKAMLLIIERDFPDLAEAVKKIETLLEIDLKTYLEVPQSITEVVQTLSKGLVQLQRCPKCSILDVLEFVNAAGLLTDYFQKGHAPRSDIYLRNVQHCQIQTTGKVIITAEECYHTNISAASIYAHCVVRGGAFFASEYILADEVGSTFGIETTLRVPREKRVKIRHAYENTIVFVGESKYRFPEERYAVAIYSKDAAS